MLRKLEERCALGLRQNKASPQTSNFQPEAVPNLTWRPSSRSSNEVLLERSEGRGLAEELEDLGIRIKQSEAEVDQAKSKLAQTEIHAPRAGLVSWNPRRPGEVASCTFLVIDGMIFTNLAREVNPVFLIKKLPEQWIYSDSL